MYISVNYINILTDYIFIFISLHLAIINLILNVKDFKFIILYNLSLKLIKISKYIYLKTIYKYKNIVYFIADFNRIVKAFILFNVIS
jgi:hypothetical protein